VSYIGIIAALPAEVKMLTLGPLLADDFFVRDQFIIRVPGIGAENATKACHLLHKQGVTALISWGCAGALDPKLSAGDIILPSQVDNGNGITIETSRDWNIALQSSLPATITSHSGLLVQSPTMITSTTHKQNLFNTTSAIAVDMESYSIGAYAQQNNLAFIACRAIADTAQTDLPQPVIDAMDQHGRINTRKVILNTLLQPLAIASLIRLGIHFSKAQATLYKISDMKQLGNQPIQPTL
jgi:adenosylhomocysteine nucleosidase